MTNYYKDIKISKCMNQKKALSQLSEIKKYGKHMRLAADGWKNNWQILTAIILSARTRDEKTIVVGEELFKKYPNPKDLAKAKLAEVEKIIKPLNFYKNKSKHIIACSKKVVVEYDSKIPITEKELITLSGVGMKTANVFLAETGYDAIGVDTHVSYISQNLGWTKNTNPDKIAEDLRKLFPKNYWKQINLDLVRFGKTYTSRIEKDKLLKVIKKIK